MLVLVNDYSTKYWLDNDIKDCSNSDINDSFELVIENEKLKVNDSFELVIENEKLKVNYNKNNRTVSNGNKNTDPKNRETEFTKNINRYKVNRQEYKNNRTFNPKKTNKYINIHRPNQSDYYKKTMSNMSTSSRISESKGTNTLLETYTKYRVKNLV